MDANPESDIAQTLGIEHSIRRTGRLKRLLVAAILLIAVVIAAIIWRRSYEKAKSPQYKTSEVRQGNLTISVTATGALEPTNQVEVGSELSGIIETVEVDYNDNVNVGQILAKLDTDQLEAQVIKSQAVLESAQASVLEAQANVLITRSELNRLRHLSKKTDGKGISQHDLDAAEAALKCAQAREDGAKAQVSQAKAVLDSDRADLEKAVIRSPIDGIVLTREVEPGQTVAASLQAPVLFTLAEDLTQMELHVDVDEADVGQVKEGQEATFAIDAYPDMSFQARVTQVRYGSQTVDGVVTYETVLNVDNSNLLLRPGMTATAEIMVKKVEHAILVPNAALRFIPPSQEKRGRKGSGGLVGSLMPRRPDASRGNKRQESENSNGEKSVWTLNDGVPVAIRVSVGATDGSMTEVAAGEIEPGMLLLVDIEEPSA